MQFSAMWGDDCHVVCCFAGYFLVTGIGFKWQHRCHARFNDIPLGNFYLTVDLSEWLVSHEPRGRKEDLETN
ncbi:hypothetical protein [Ferruginibacter sp.]